MSETYITRKEKRSIPHAYATLNGINLLTTYKMELVSFNIGSPVPLIKLIKVPGRPGKLDATLSLNGKVNYIYRIIEAEFHIRDITQNAFQTLVSTLLKAYNGTESKLVFSTDPNWYYKGRFSVESEKTNPVTGTILLQCSEAFPYKLEEITVEDTISDSKYVNCTGREYNSSPTIYCSVAMSITFNGKTYQLKAGNNKIPEICFKSGSNSIRFVGTGAVKITYERGIL